MKNDIQQMAYRMQVEVQGKQNDAVIRAVQRFYGCRNESMRQMAERTVYMFEGGDAVLRDKKTDKVIIIVRPHTTIAHDYGVTFQVNYLTFDGKK